MSDQDFLGMVKKHGAYGSQGEASRAAHAVFGTIKAWISPAASDMVREALPRDASQLWQYSSVAYGGGTPGQIQAGDEQAEPAHFFLKVQQLGKYCSSNEARRATRSVLTAFARSLSVEPGRFLGQALPPEILKACRPSSSRAA